MPGRSSLSDMRYSLVALNLSIWVYATASLAHALA